MNLHTHTHKHTHAQILIRDRCLDLCLTAIDPSKLLLECVALLIDHYYPADWPQLIGMYICILFATHTHTRQRLYMPKDHHMQGLLANKSMPHPIEPAFLYFKHTHTHTHTHTHIHTHTGNINVFLNTPEPHLGRNVLYVLRKLAKKYEAVVGLCRTCV